MTLSAADIAALAHSWVPDPRGVNDVLNDPENEYPVFATGAYAIRDAVQSIETHLWDPLIWCDPDYARGRQLIGSCVAWGLELAQTLLIAKHCFKRRSKRDWCEAATEPNYGGARVEVRGKKRGGRRDGAYGAAAADWSRRWGTLQRLDYSKQTGNPEHDLRVYSGKKEKDWGDYGCGGRNDKGKLDSLAKIHPCKTISQCHSFDDVSAAIEVSKCPVTIASKYGCSMRRNKHGECKWSGSWSHQMVLVGVRYDRPGALCAQSWGPNVATGPHYPARMPKNIRGFTWWIPAADVDRICRSGDCWAIGDQDGWKRDRSDFRKAFSEFVIR